MPDRKNWLHQTIDYGKTAIEHITQPRVVTRLRTETIIASAYVGSAFLLSQTGTNAVNIEARGLIAIGLTALMIGMIETRRIIVNSR